MRKIPVRPVSQASLEKTALWHLARRALTVQQLEAILERKMTRAARAGVEPRGPLDVPALVEKLKRLGFLDDTRVSEGRARAMRDRGASGRKIAMRLRRDGVDAALIREAVASTPADELEAARTWARKRRLAQKDPQKALAALARQGFSFDVARRALASADDDTDADAEIAD